MSYITIDKLSLSYGENKVLKDISLTIEEGELVTLLGPSGCGKSTLLRVLAGLEVFQDGDLYIDGEIINDVPPKDRNVGMVFQSYALFPNMTVFENVAFGLSIKKSPREEIEQKVMQMLNLVNLADKKDFYVHQLSGGQQQRISLARSLVTEPRFLLLDEPLSALDAKIRKQLQMDIRDLQRKLGITMIFVTHDQEEAMILSDKIFLMSEGEIVQKALPAELYSQPKNQFVAGFIGNYNILSTEKLKNLNPTFSADDSEKTYALRSELINLSPISGPSIVRLEGILENYTILGSTIRCYFKVNEIRLTVDLLNNRIDLAELNNQTELFIDKNNLVAINE